jgi:oligopeptide transport system permease protein
VKKVEKNIQKVNLIDLSEFSLSDEELFSRVDHDQKESEKITAPRYSYWSSVFRVFFKNKVNIIILAVLGVVLLFSYVYPMFVEYDRFANIADSSSLHLHPDAAIKKFGFSLSWILGSGSSGQPTFDAVWYGSRISITLALICAVINMTVGVILGAIWGFSKRFDLFMTEVYNIIGNIPYILFIAVMVMIFTPGFWTLVFALTITGWLGIAYFIRTQVVIIRDREYNLVSRCLGTPTFRIAMKNILPFMTSIIVTLAATEIPSYISYEVFLSYIGMGMSDMSLGKLIYESQSAMVTPGWGFEFWSPVIVASIITVVLYVVGQNLGDASDPRTHM